MKEIFIYDKLFRVVTHATAIAIYTSSCLMTMTVLLKWWSWLIYVRWCNEIHKLRKLLRAKPITCHIAVCTCIIPVPTPSSGNATLFFKYITTSMIVNRYFCGCNTILFSFIRWQRRVRSIVRWRLAGELNIWIVQVILSEFYMRPSLFTRILKLFLQCPALYAMCVDNMYHRVPNYEFQYRKDAFPYINFIRLYFSWVYRDTDSGVRFFLGWLYRV